MSAVTHTESSLSRLSILVPFESPPEVRERLESSGAKLVLCPALKIGPPEAYAALDAVIEELYGYDWLIFINRHSVSAFLGRLNTLGHEISELDSFRVAALGESTVSALEESQVHVDLIPEDFRATKVVEALARYTGSTDDLRGLNFLLPRATIGRDYLQNELDEAGARADAVASYRTAAAGDSSLMRLRTLIINGGIDCVVFASPAEVQSFASLFDVNDLSPLLRDVPAACLDDSTSEVAARYGICDITKTSGHFVSELVLSITARFRR